MAITDIIVLVILALGMLIGFIKGFFKSLASLLGTLVSLVLAYVLTTFTLDLITSIPGLHNVLYGESGSLASSISGGLPNAMKDMTVIEASTDAGKQAISDALGGGIMGLFTPLILSLVNKFATADLQSVPMADCIGVIAARSIAWVVLFIVYFIVLKLLSMLLRRMGNWMQRRHVSSVIDRVFGFVIGGVKGLIFNVVLLFVLSLMSGFGFMSAYRADMDKSVIAKPISDFTIKIIGGYVDIGRLTGGLIPTPEAEEKTEATSEKSIENTAAIETARQDFFNGLPTVGEGLAWALL